MARRAARRRTNDSPNVSFFAFQDIITAVSGILIVMVLLMSLMLEEQDEPNPPTNAEGDMKNELAQIANELRQLRDKNEDLKGKIAAIEGVSDSNVLEGDIASLKKSKGLLDESIATVKDKLITLVGDETSTAEQIAALEKKITDLQLEITEQEEKNEKIKGAVESKADDLEQKKAGMKSNVVFTPADWPSSEEPVPVVIEGAEVRIGSFSDAAAEVILKANGAQADFASHLDGLDPSRHYIFLMLKPSGVPLFDRLLLEVESRNFKYASTALEEGVSPVFNAIKGDPEN